MKVAVFGLPFSPNLGDGVIAECLAWGLSQHNPQAQVRTVDLSGRLDFTSRPSPTRVAALAMIDALPEPVVHVIARQLLAPRMAAHAAAHWDAIVRDSDAVILGGGQLLADHALNFPIKIAALADVCAAHGKPLAIYAVGCARQFSPEGRKLLARFVESPLLRFIAVRDADSRRNLLENFKPAKPVTIVRDPALIAGRVYHSARSGENGAYGVGVTHPSVLRAHVRSGAAGMMPGFAFQKAVAEDLSARVGRVSLFSNGAYEDHALVPAFGKLADNAAPRPQTPAELVATIDAFEGIAAHRLHACILAIALGRKVVGFTWDSKMTAFFSSIGHAENLFAPDTRASATLAVNRLLHSQPVAARASLADETHEQIGGVMRAFG